MSQYDRLAVTMTGLALLGIWLTIAALGLAWDPPRHPTVQLPVPAWASTPVGTCCMTPFANALRVDRLRAERSAK